MKLRQSLNQASAASSPVSVGEVGGGGAGRSAEALPLACLVFHPSLPHLWVSINSTHWYFLFSVVLTGAWRWAVGRLPW